MRKASGFEDEVAALSDEVETNVAGMLQVLKDRPPARLEVTDRPLMPVGASQASTIGSPERTLDRPNQKRTNASSKEGDHSGRKNLQIGTGQVNVTTRLSQQINERLTEAALRQRLKRVGPATRQGILEEALADWLQKHGYHR